MIVTFGEEYLRELYETGKNREKNHLYQPEIVRKYIQRINILKSNSTIESLYNIHSLNYEVLKGKKNGISSIRVNKQYRIEFTVSEDKKENIVTICNILELSNHYK